jgi:DNA topoisomerase-3
VTVSITLGSKQQKESFKLIGTKLIDEGYIEVMPWVEFSNTKIPDLIKHTHFKPNDIRLAQRKVSIISNFQTSAPGFLTESQLISVME